MESLVLNTGSVPISIVPYRRALTLVMAQKAIVLETYPGTQIRSAFLNMQIPSVIQCTQSNYFPKEYVSVLPFTRQNVYTRDQGRCQYCGKKVSLNLFSFDHVVPRCQGGKSSWTNVVICCLRCNSEKGGQSLSKYKRKLIRQPYAPRLTKAAPAHLVNRIALDIPHITWRDYIYWGAILLP